MQIGRSWCPVLFIEVCLLNDKIRDKQISLFEKACKKRVLYVITILVFRKISAFVQLLEYKVKYNSYNYILSWWITSIEG